MTGLCLFVHIGIRYDFRTAGAVADEAADKRPVLEDSAALAFGAMDIDKPRGKRSGDDLGPLSGDIDRLPYRDEAFDTISREDIHHLLLYSWIDIRHVPVGLTVRFLGHSSVR